MAEVEENKCLQDFGEKFVKLYYLNIRKNDQFSQNSIGNNLFGKLYMYTHTHTPHGQTLSELSPHRG